MSLKILETKDFLKFFKRLNKKYRKLVFDYEILVDILETGNHNAVEVTENIYKIHLKNSSNPKGKSSGFRVIYFFKTQTNVIYLLDIFSKSETDNIKKDKLVELVRVYGLTNE